MRASAGMSVTERGSGTVALMGAVLSVVLLGGVGVSVASQVILTQRISHAVDSAALAASDVSRGVVPGEPCQVASDILADAGARLTLCDDEGDSVVVQGRLTRGPQVALATARAGVVDSGEK